MNRAMGLNDRDYMRERSYTEQLTRSTSTKPPRSRSGRTSLLAVVALLVIVLLDLFVLPHVMIAGRHWTLFGGI
jgi:hypothetical protein